MKNVDIIEGGTFRKYPAKEYDNFYTCESQFRAVAADLYGNLWKFIKTTTLRCSLYL